MQMPVRDNIHRIIDHTLVLFLNMQKLQLVGHLEKRIVVLSSTNIYTNFPNWGSEFSFLKKLNDK